MSDYITELRRELVGAAERQQRRSVPRRAVRRSRRPIMTGLAGVAAAAALVLGIVLGARELSNPAPAAPRVVATVRFGGIPTGAALGAGSVWVTGLDGSLWRIDPERRRVVATIDVGTEAKQVAASGDAVWVVADEQNRRHRLMRLDPTGRVVAKIADLGPVGCCGAILAAGPGAVWLQTYQESPGPLTRVDPATNRVAASYGRRGPIAIAVGGGRLWTLSWQGLLEWRNAATGALLGRAEGLALDPPGGAYRNAIVPDADGAWIATAEDGAVTRVSSDGRFGWSVRVRANGVLAHARGSLWVATGDEIDGRRNEIVRLDAGDGHVTGRLALGARVPQALIPIGDELWAVLSDGTALVVR